MALAVVQSAEAVIGGDSTTATFGSTTTTGNLIVVAIAEFGGTTFNTGTPVTDNKGNTYAFCDETIGGGSGAGAAIFRCENATGGASHQITVNVPGTGLALSFAILEISGAATSGAFDKSANASASTNNSATSGSTGTLAMADEIAVVVLGLDAGVNGTITEDASFVLAQEEMDGLLFIPYNCSTKIVAATTAINHTWTHDYGAINARAVIATFKSAAASAPSAPSEIRAVAENDGASLVWPVPGDGGSAITDYLIEQNVNAGGWTTISHSASTNPFYHVTGLTTADSVIFRVSAINAIGTGSASPSSRTITVLGIRSIAHALTPLLGRFTYNSKWRFRSGSVGPNRLLRSKPRLINSSTGAVGTDWDSAGARVAIDYLWATSTVDLRQGAATAHVAVYATAAGTKIAQDGTKAGLGINARAAGSKIGQGAAKAGVVVWAKEVGSKATQGTTAAPAGVWSKVAGSKLTGGTAKVGLAIGAKAADTKVAQGATKAGVGVAAKASATKIAQGSGKTPLAVAAREAASKLAQGAAKVFVTVWSPVFGTKIGGAVEGSARAIVSVWAKATGAKTVGGGAKAGIAAIAKEAGSKIVSGSAKAGFGIDAKQSATKVGQGSGKASIAVFVGSATLKIVSGVAKVAVAIWSKVTGFELGGPVITGPRTTTYGNTDRLTTGSGLNRATRFGNTDRVTTGSGLNRATSSSTTDRTTGDPPP